MVFIYALLSFWFLLLFLMNIEKKNKKTDTITVSFTDKDGLFTFTVKKEFLNICPNPNHLTIYELAKLKYSNFLHNDKGLSIIINNQNGNFDEKMLLTSKFINTSDNKMGAYCINGEMVTKGEWIELQLKKVGV